MGYDNQQTKSNRRRFVWQWITHIYDLRWRIDVERMNVPRTRLAWLNTNLTGRQLTCIAVKYAMVAKFGSFLLGVWKSLHKATANAFPHGTANAPKLGTIIQNSWYDEECHVIRRHFQCEVTKGICTQTIKSNLPTPSEEKKDNIFG